jgi:flagellar basal-body rod modification protein FlgD
MAVIETPISQIPVKQDVLQTPVVKATKTLGQKEFLQLLTAQLQYQDPLKPMDNEAFIAQMATFSQLDQTSTLVALTQKLVDYQAAANPAQQESGSQTTTA